jgi:serine/threonine protein kinase
MQASAFDQGTVLHDEYVLQGPVGDHQGRLHHATHVVSGRAVVVRLWRSDDAAVLARVLERLEIASRIRHPALASLEAFGRGPDGSVFLVSESVAGETLDRWADRAGIPPLPSVIDLAQRLCVGLNAAHRNGLAHDALNPRNVMVTLDAQEPARLDGKLLDLSVPACMRSWPPRLGAARFMAPEQLLRALRADEAVRGADAAMNVYSCGSLLYYLCTGGAPYPGRNLEHLALAHAEQKLVPPAKINPQIPGSLQAVILRALAFEPEQRFASMSDLGAALAGVNMLGQSTPAIVAGPGRERRRARHAFEDRPTSEMATPPVRSPSPASVRTAPTASPSRVPPLPSLRSRPSSPSPSLPPLPPLAPSRSASELAKPPRSTAPLGSFSGPLPLAPSEEARARLSTPPSTRAEPPELLPISALLAEPVALAVAPPLDAIVVSSDAEHALQPYAAPQRAQPRGRARLTLASTAAFALVLAASAASAYVLLYPGFVAEAPVSRTPPSPGAPSRAGPRRRAAAPVAPAVAVQRPALPLADAVPPPAAAVAPAEVVASGVEPQRRRHEAPRSSAAPQLDASSARAVERGRAVLRIQAADPSELVADTDVAALEPADAPPPAVAQAAPALAALHDDRPVAATASQLDATKVPQRAAPLPGPEPPLARTRSSARLAATPQVRELSVRGSLATSEVRRAVDRIKPQLAACYAQAARAAGRNGFGELSFEVEIDERGRAHAPQVRGGGLPGLERCVERATSKLAARPPDTGTVKAAWKVAFEP